MIHAFIFVFYSLKIIKEKMGESNGNLKFAVTFFYNRMLKRAKVSEIIGFSLENFLSILVKIRRQTIRRSWLFYGAYWRKYL